MFALIKSLSKHLSDALELRLLLRATFVLFIGGRARSPQRGIRTSAHFVVRFASAVDVHQCEHRAVNSVIRRAIGTNAQRIAAALVISHFGLTKPPGVHYLKQKYFNIRDD